MIRLSRENARVGRALEPALSHDAVVARETHVPMPTDYNAPLPHACAPSRSAVLLRRIVGGLVRSMTAGE
jgi:hypothetical protein